MNECSNDIHRLPNCLRCVHLGDAYIDELSTCDRETGEIKTLVFAGIRGQEVYEVNSWAEAEAWLLTEAVSV